MKTEVLLERYPYRYVQSGTIELNGRPDYRIQKFDEWTKRYKDMYLLDNSIQLDYAMEDFEYTKWLDPDRVFLLCSRPSKTMTSYQKAIKALEECVKDAMENDVDPGLQMEIWRHYQGMKAIDRQLPKPPRFSFKLDGVDRVFDEYDPDYNIQAAQPVDLGDTYGKDVITFS